MIVGAIETHPDKRDPSKSCSGSIHFDVEHSTDTPKWKVVSVDPLSLTPSIACRTCGRHGYVTGGRWIPAE